LAGLQRVQEADSLRGHLQPLLRVHLQRAAEKLRLLHLRLLGRAFARPKPPQPGVRRGNCAVALIAGPRRGAPRRPRRQVRAFLLPTRAPATSSRSGAPDW